MDNFKSDFKRPKIGLALGGGGARGLAHIGVIKILEKNKIPIDLIAGSSIGAIIGGFYASGLNIKEIEKIALDIDYHKIFSVLFEPRLKQGLIGGEKIKIFIENYIGKKNFKDCRIPFSAVATNLKTGEIVPLNKGEIAQAIQASISIPLIFKPVKINNQTLIDGELSSPVPVEVVRNMGADIIIAVNLDKYHHTNKKDLNWYDIANNSLSILRYHLAQQNIKNADIVIKVDLKSYWYQFVNGQGKKILAGEKAAKKVIPKLQKIISKNSEA